MKYLKRSSMRDPHEHRKVNNDTKTNISRGACLFLPALRMKTRLQSSTDMEGNQPGSFVQSKDHWESLSVDSFSSSFDKNHRIGMVGRSSIEWEQTSSSFSGFDMLTR